MKVSNASLLALLLPAVSARFVEHSEPDRTILFPDGMPDIPKDTTKYHIELAPGDTRWVTEEEKWELRRVCIPLQIYRCFLSINRSFAERPTLLRHN